MSLSLFRLLAQSDGTVPKSWLAIIAVIIIVIILLNMNYRRKTMGGSPKQYRREIDTANMKTTAIHRDMENLLVELNELSRQINAQIDTKFAKLEQSIADADKRIQFLRILLDAAKKAELTDAPVPAEPTEQKPGSDAVTTSTKLDITVGDEGITWPPKSEEKTAPTDNDDYDESDELQRRIYRMADEGQSPVNIARKLQQNIGEVELILNLRPRTNGAD